MSDTAQEPAWNELGPCMRELSEMQSRFVHFYVAEVAVKPHGAATRAAAKAGYKSGSRANLSKHASDLLRDPIRSEKIIAAIAEESKKLIRVGHPEAVAALFGIIRDPTHKDHVRAIGMVLDRTDPAVSRHDLQVTHKHIDPDREALEELKALRKLGTSRDKLLELYGANGLDRLEGLEAVEQAQRSAAAKIIEHNEAHDG